MADRDRRPRTMTGTLEDGTEVLVTIWVDEDDGGELALRDPLVSATWGPPITLREEE